jgi:hypothetical protein
MTNLVIYITEVYADPTHSSYDALEFAFGLFSTFTPAVTLILDINFACCVVYVPQPQRIHKRFFPSFHRLASR